MATKSKVALTEAQIGFANNIAHAISGILNTEKAQKEGIAKLKEEAKKAIVQHYVELNLNLKDLKLSKFRWTGTAKSNAVIGAIYSAFKTSGQSDATAMNSVSAVKACYTGDIGADHKFPNGLEVPEFNKNRIVKRKVFKGLLDGKDIAIDRGDISCANALIKAMGQEGFEEVARAFIKELGADPRKITAEEITVSFQSALTSTKRAILKDGKVVPK